MSIRLTPDQIASAAAAAGYEPRAVRAVIQVETGGSGYDATTGYLLIQFEPSWFRRLLPKATLAAITAAGKAPAPTAAQKQLLVDWQVTQANAVEGQARERLAFDAACRIDKHAALLSTSWGLPQMMGFNAQACGYKTVEEMVEAFRQSEANQVAGMLGFIKSKPAMAAALKKKDWAVLAYYYNGAGYKAFNYDRRLAAAYNALA
jgi:hypothetical protein